MSTAKCGICRPLPDGQKLFIQESGGRTGGCFFVIGEVQPDLYDAHIICIAEGYATGMSIHMATGHPVALSFVANNLPKVGAVLRQKYQMPCLSTALMMTVLNKIQA